MIEREGVVISSFLRISNSLTTLQKNLERAKSLRARPLNLKNGEVLVMYLFYDNPDGLSAEQLSRVCMLDRSLISRSLRSLSAKRLITCPRVAEGKRRYGSKLILTEEGRRVGGIVKQHVREAQAFLREGITDEELEIMYSTLEKLCARFEEYNRLTRAELKSKKESI